MSWVTREKEVRRNRERGKVLLQDAWERAYLLLEGRHAKEGGINQTELAPKIGVSQPTLSSWVAYAKRAKTDKAYLPNASNLLLLPQALGVNPMWLFYGIGEATDAQIAGPSPSRDAALRGQYKLLQDLQEWVGERETLIFSQLHQAPVSDGGGPGPSTPPPRGDL